VPAAHSKRVRLGFGGRPALVVVDLLRAYTTRGSPLHAPGVVRAVAALPPLLAAARRAGIPILHTRVWYTPPHYADGGAWVLKAPVLRMLVPGEALAEFCPKALPAPGETVIRKQYSSAFASTSIASTLRAARVDTVLLAGCTTSGCVRASAVDAIQNGFRPIIVRECVGDRHPDPHRAALADMARMYGDVITREAAIRYLRTRRQGKRT
jgi:maleamate amidohydrolase